MLTRLEGGGVEYGFDTMDGELARGICRIDVAGIASSGCRCSVSTDTLRSRSRTGLFEAGAVPRGKA